jgi:DNA modification methylase
LITTHHGDCTAVLPTLPANSVQCVVTSPPYLGLRQYTGVVPTVWPEIEYAPMAGLPTVTVPAMECVPGDEGDPLAYVAHLVAVFRLVWRMLRDDGVVWLNLGDSYAQGNRQTGVPDKNLLLIPARAALALQADGWYLRSDIVWSKPRPMPESVQDRPTKSHEHVFLLAKNSCYFYDAQAIAEPAQNWRPCNRANGKYHNHGTGLQPHAGLERSYETRNVRDVWTLAPPNFNGAHFAVFPEALPRRCILAGSSPQACERCGAPWQRVVEREPMEIVRSDRRKQMGMNGRTQPSGTMVAPARTCTVGWRPTCDCENEGTGRCLVLDPFAGSGTTLRVAEALGRDSIGIEAGDYAHLQEERTSAIQVEMFPGVG